eukprot:gene7711-879_t
MEKRDLVTLTGRDRAHPDRLQQGHAEQRIKQIYFARPFGNCRSEAELSPSHRAEPRCYRPRSLVASFKIDLSTFEETARGAYQLLDAIAPIFDKKYVDRSPNELAQVAQVISLVKVFRKMEPEVLTFLAAHASLAVMWESNELPRNMFRKMKPEVLIFLAAHASLAVMWASNELPRNNLDRSNMYSIVSGAVKGIVGDENDPHLRNLVKMAADELVEMHAAKIIGEEISTSRTNFNAAYGLVGTEYGSKLVRNKIWRSVLFHINQGHGQKGGSRKSATRSGDLSCSTFTRVTARQVRNKIWRSVLFHIHQGHGQKVTSRKQSLIGSTAHGSLMRGESAGHQPEGGPGPGTSPRASDPAEGMAIANHIKRDQLDPAAGQIAADIEAVVEVVTEIQDELAEELKREAEEKKTSRHTIPNGPTIATFEAWDSFSGCNLDCRAESGQSEYQMLDFPQKVHGAVSVKDCLVTMLVISKQAYSKAMHMQMDLLVQKNVDHCCRLPFLRHTPLRELFRLSRYLQEETFSRGTTILQQGKENTSLHFLIQGEVEIVIDLPLSTNKTLLAASLQAGQLAERPASLAHAPSMARRNIQNLDGSPVHPDVMTAIMYKGPMQRIMLGRRGPGVVLGDDSLRERRMVVSVVALSGTVKTLSITPQRFSMCIDPLTLRLMHKLQKQHNATAEFTSAVGDVSGRTLLLDRCREVMLTQSYERMKKPIKVNPTEGDSKLWKRSDAVGSHFSSSESLTEGERRVKATEGDSKLWKRSDAVGGHFSSFESLTEGERSVNAIEGDSKLWKRSDAVGGHFSSFESLTEGERRVLAAEEAAAAAIKAGLYEAHAQVMLSPRTMVATNAATSRAVSGSKVPLVGISTSMFKGMRVGGSLAKFIETVQTVEEQRAVQQVVDAKMRQKMVDLDLTGETHPSVVKKLDISGSGVSMASHRVYTDMVEAAAIACIRVGFVPGQPEIPMDELAPVLDDAAVAWSQIAHESELQLVRWKSHEFYLLGGLGMGRGKKPMVRMISDSLLQILESFKNIIAHNPVPHHTFSAGLAIGAIFASYDCGRFMTGVSGQAAVAAQKLCAKSCADFPTGHISNPRAQFVASGNQLATSRTHELQFVASGNQLATSRTHELRFVASGYQLVRAVELPYSAKFDDVFGRGSLEKEPVSQGNTALASLNVQAIKSSHFGDSGTWYSLDDGLPCTGPVSADASSGTWYSLDDGLPCTGPVSADASRSNLNQTPASPTGRLTLSPITVQADKSYNADSDSPASASGSPKLTMKSHGTRRGSNLDGAKRKHGLKALPGQLQADPSHISDSGKQAATAPRTTLEPHSSGHKTHDDSDNPIASWSLKAWGPRTAPAQQGERQGLGPSTRASASASRADGAGCRQGSREQALAPAPAPAGLTGQGAGREAGSREAAGGTHSITPYGPGTKLGNLYGVPGGGSWDGENSLYASLHFFPFLPDHFLPAVPHFSKRDPPGTSPAGERPHEIEMEKQRKGQLRKKQLRARKQGDRPTPIACPPSSGTHRQTAASNNPNLSIQAAPYTRRASTVQVLLEKIAPLVPSSYRASQRGKASTAHEAASAAVPAPS